MKNNSYIIVANGKFPTHSIPLKILRSAKNIICCDGAVNKLEKTGMEANYIIGDMDSIKDELKTKYQDRIIELPDQKENDLRKALKWADNNNAHKVSIIGGTGIRDDHSLANIFTLLQYSSQLEAKMYTDFGIFTTIDKKSKIKSYKGQQVSLFSYDPSIRITSYNLKYNLNNDHLCTLYSGTLNQSLNDNFTLILSHGKILVFQEY